MAVDLMEKRSSKYSSRPRFVAMGELYWDMAPVLVQPYNKEWSIRRKLLHHALTPAALRTYKQRQEAEASRLMFQILQRPQNWEQSIERFTASIVFSIAYGHRIDSLDSAVMKKRFEFMHYSASLNVPGAYAVESFPFLKYMPTCLAPWKREIMNLGRREAEENMALLEEVKQDIVEAKWEGKEVAASLTRDLLRMRTEENIPLSDRDLSFVPATLFGAGSDTTASTMCTAILAFVTHPQALRRAQKEVDDVIGSERSPVFADEPNLPYVRALVKEVLRWRPVAVLGGTPHSSSEDDIYQGYKIPAGTTVLGNSWAINLHQEYYPDPHNFNPERFLDPKDSSVDFKSLKGRAHPSKTGHSSFGWGRRICPGADLATNTLFVALSKLVWAFNIRGIEGRVYDTLDYTDGFNIRPRKFECLIQARNEAHLNVLRQENEKAEDIMAKFAPFRP